MECHNSYNNIISIENLLASWQEFLRGKKSRKDVARFSVRLSDNIMKLHYDLKNKTYTHGLYEGFKINDPKPRDIHKASVRDRLLHHAIYRALYPFFDKKFVHDSYSCRAGKGTHKALYRFESVVQKVSKNNTKQCWILKCDIKKFFANIDRNILKQILTRHISDKDTLWLLERVIDSFHISSYKGLPLGNLTSQLLVNVYMNEFDQFVKHNLKAKHYIRYADDFVFLSQDKDYLERLLPEVENFLENKLKLEIHPKKVSITTIGSGVDFLGWVHFPKHRVLRMSSKRRMLKKVAVGEEETIQSYLGMLKHGSAHKLREYIKMDIK
jgi:retron-type reverse transcriptase